MPRKPRIDYPGLLYHIIVRGIEKAKIFKDEQDRQGFIIRLGEQLKIHGAQCFGWTLMSNHIHLIIRRGEKPLSSLMRHLLTGYAVNFNLRHKRVGHLFQNRYKAVICDEEIYLLELIRYVHLNPVRARIIKDIRELDLYPWTGHSYLVGENKNEWQEIEEVLSYFGKKREDAQQRYRRFVEEAIISERRQDLEGGGLIRSKGRREPYDDRILGDGNFVEQILRKVEEKEKKGESIIGREELATEISRYFGIDRKAIFKKSNQPTIVRARDVYCYLSCEMLKKTGEELRKELNKTSAAISISKRRGEGIFENEEGLRRIIFFRRC